MASPISPLLPLFLTAVKANAALGTISGVAVISLIAVIIRRNFGSKWNASTLLILNLLLADLLHAVDNQFNYVWLSHGGVFRGLTCTIQGSLLNFADVSS